MSTKKPASQAPTKQRGGGKDAPQPTQQMGEGSYEGTRDYQNNITDYLANADVAADARAAQPADEAEAARLKRAEKEGLSHSRARGK